MPVCRNKNVVHELCYTDTNARQICAESKSRVMANLSPQTWYRSSRSYDMLYLYLEYISAPKYLDDEMGI